MRALSPDLTGAVFVAGFAPPRSTPAATDFRRSANVGFGNAPVRSCSFHGGKINAKFRGDSSRNRRRFHAGFFGFLFSRLRLLLRRLSSGG